jgi:hypothetical protein
MNAKTIGYWATTGLLSFAMLASGFAYLSGGMDEAMGQHLGYPAHFITILGTWKLLVAPALLAPGFAKVKEWAYAGLFFTLTGAALAHIAVGDGAGEVLPPIFMLAFAGVSYALKDEVRGLEPIVAPQAVPAK